MLAFLAEAEPGAEAWWAWRKLMVKAGHNVGAQELYLFSLDWFVQEI